MSHVRVNFKIHAIIDRLRFSDRYKDFQNINDILDYSYKTQTEIEINNIELMKMIGDEVDPYQGEIELLLSKTRES